MSKFEANYSKFTTLPSNWTRPIWNEARNEVLNPNDPFKWSGKNDPPAIGAKVKVYMNMLGEGTVTSYWVEHGWLGVLVKFDNPPEWYVKQNGAEKHGHVVGLELEPFIRKEKPDAV